MHMTETDDYDKENPYLLFIFFIKYSAMKDTHRLICKQINTNIRYDITVQMGI